MGREYVQDEVTSRIVTYTELDDRPPRLLVEQVYGDSTFRAAGLRVGDEIIAVDGAPIVRHGTPGAPPIYEHVGQYGESQRWAREGRKEGAPLRLTVRRRRRPAGWEQLEIAATLRNTRVWCNDADRNTVGEGGPDRMASDGYDESWQAWYDRVAKIAGNVLRTWHRNVLTTRYELSQLAEHQARLDDLAARFPGPYTAALLDDVAAARALLLGEPTEVTDLAWRSAEETRRQQVAEQAAAAWEAWRSARAGDIIPAFPAPDPIKADIRPSVGKIVVLPAIHNRDWIPEGGHNYLAAGDDYQGWYFIDAETEPVYRMLRASRRYERLVSPNIRATYEIAGRVLPQPRVLVMNGRGRFGLQIEPAAVLAGDGALFADLDTFDGEISRFTGEEAFLRPAGELPPDGASPAEVLDCLIDAIKDGDQPRWRALFAPWSIRWMQGDRPVYSPWGAQVREGDWEDSRRRVLDTVWDARVVWIGEPVAITEGGEFPGAPRVEQIDVHVEHIGQIDGVLRPFRDITVHPFWQLQRLDQGPWRVSSCQSI